MPILIYMSAFIRRALISLIDYAGARFYQVAQVFTLTASNIAERCHRRHITAVTTF